MLILPRCLARGHELGIKRNYHLGPWVAKSREYKGLPPSLVKLKVDRYQDASLLYTDTIVFLRQF